MVGRWDRRGDIFAVADSLRIVYSIERLMRKRGIINTVLVLIRVTIIRTDRSP